jgi:hypothetical protein
MFILIFVTFFIFMISIAILVLCTAMIVVVSAVSISIGFVQGSCLTVEGSCLTVEGSCFTVEGSCFTVEGMIAFVLRRKVSLLMSGMMVRGMARMAKLDAVLLCFATALPTTILFSTSTSLSTCTSHTLTQPPLCLIYCPPVL